MSHRRMSPAHETRTRSGITVADPDQGTPYIQVQFAFPSTMLMVYEPFEDGTEGGHNLLGLARRWAEWVAGTEPFLETRELRFGYPQLIPRSAIPHVAGLLVAYHRKEDSRAGYRGAGLAVPGGGGFVRQLPNGGVEISVPRRA